MIWQIQVITFTEERISAGRAALSAVGNQMDGQNTLTFTARKARKTEIAGCRTAHWQLPHDGKGAFFVVSGKDQREAVHALQI